MQTEYPLPRRLLLIFMLSILSFSLTLAQGHGGNGGHGGSGGGHGGPGGPGGGQPNDSTHCDSSGFGWDHDGPGWDGDSTGHGHHGDDHGWSHGDSTDCDSTGHGGQHGNGHDWHGWGQHDSTSLDSILVNGIIQTISDTLGFGGGHGCPGSPDSGEVIITNYLLDIDADDLPDYHLRGLGRLAHADSNFILPEAGDQVTVFGFLHDHGDGIDRILVRDLEVITETDGFEGLTSITPSIASQDFRLASKVYPNPFNPSTVIEFILPKAGLTILKIYDIRGVEQVTLVNTYLEEGVHTTRFSPKGLSAGTYLYMIESNGYREVQRFAYLK